MSSNIMVFFLGDLLIIAAITWPAVVVTALFFKQRQFYAFNQTAIRPKKLYLVALAAAALSTVAYLGYATWRFGRIYNVEFPFAAMLFLERTMYLGRVLAPIAFICLMFGRGPLRWLMGLSILWVMWHLWAHGAIIHWA